LEYDYELGFKAGEILLDLSRELRSKTEVERTSPMSANNTIRSFLIFEAATLIVASLIHSGVLITGYEHQKARIAETVIAIVLLTAAASTWIHPAMTRKAGLAGQTIALMGTLIGVFTIVVGVGPRTTPDIAYHVAIVAVLFWGLATTKRV
jgi:hypothetical protein